MRAVHPAHRFVFGSVDAQRNVPFFYRGTAGGSADS